MADTIPTTKTDLLSSVGKSLSAQARLREVMQGVAAETAAGRQLGKQAPASGATK